MDLFSNLQIEQQKNIPNKSEPEIIVDITYLNNQSILFEQNAKRNPFYDKNIIFSEKLMGNKFIEFQIIGNLGGWANDRELTSDADYYIISKQLMDEIKNNPSHPMLEKLNDLLNVYSIAEKKRIRNYKFKKLQIISEDSFLKHVTKRCENIDDSVTMKLISKLKES